MDIGALFCEIDEFCVDFEPKFNQHVIQETGIKRHKPATWCLSEVMTLIVWFHGSGYRTFKDYYTKEVTKHLCWAFPKLVSSNRFVELMPAAVLPLCCYLHTRKGTCSGIAFIDSMPIAVCHNRRIPAHKVFATVARRGKNSVDGFYGFKLHLIVNDQGALLAFRLTPGNVDDRQPVPQMVKGLFGKLFGDRGSISQQLFRQLFTQGLHLVTKIKTKMKNKLIALFDKLMLRKRALMETIHDQLKNISQIEHSRHRSVANCFVNVVAALIAYTYREKKPSLRIRVTDHRPLPAVIL